MSKLVNRDVYGFDKDKNDEKKNIIITTCYMLYNNLNRSYLTFNK